MNAPEVVALELAIITMMSASDEDVPVCGASSVSVLAT